MSQGHFARRTRALLARAWMDCSGGTAMEFAVLSPVVIALLLATLQVAVLWFAKTELQSATDTAARLVFTGQPSASSQSTFKTALCANLPVIIQCNGVNLSLSVQASLSSVTTAPPTLTYNAQGQVTNTFTYDPGNVNDIMVLQVLYQMPVLAGPFFSFSTQANGTALLVSTVVFVNEPL